LISKDAPILQILSIHCSIKRYLQLIEFAAVIGEPTGGRFGLRPPQEWKLYRLHSIPGLIVVPNPFLAGGQLHWVARCLLDYPCKPNICNLDAHIVRNGEGRLWPKVNVSVTEDTGRASGDGGIAESTEEEEEGRALKRVKVSKEEVVSKDSDLYRLRWVTLGYHYDWNTKEYRKDRWSPFPNDLGEMAAFILKVCGFPK
jgi:alkylated DNA repair protein alkB family protein 1